MESTPDSPLILAAHFAHSADAMLVVDTAGVIVAINRAAELLFGYQDQTLIGDALEKLVPADLVTRHQEHRRGFAHDPGARLMGQQSLPLLGRKQDGTLFPAEVSLSPAGTGETLTVLAIVRDITERLAIDAENQVVRQSLDSVEEAVFMFDAESLAFFYVNSGAVAQTGYSREELLDGMTPLSIKPLFDRPSFTDLLAPLLSGERSVVTFETRHRRSDGSEVPVEVMLQRPDVQIDGNDCLMALVRDISVRHHQHERLVRSERAFRSAFEDAPVGMAIADLSDPDLRPIVAANTALAEMLGYHKSDLIGRTFDSLTFPADRADDPVGATHLSQGVISTYRTEKRYLHADGHPVWALLSAVALEGPDGVQSLAHVVDISRRVAVEAERDQREVFLSFLGDIRLAVLSERPLDDVLGLILSTAKSALSAEHLLVAMPDATGALRIRAMDTVASSGKVGDALPEGSHEGRAHGNAETLLVADLVESPGAGPASRILNRGVGPAVISPLMSGGRSQGILVVGRATGGNAFSKSDLGFIAALSEESAVAFQLQAARDQQTRLRLAEERERIARELQDRVIQRLFAVGMSLQGNAESPERLKQAAGEAVEEIDSSIAVIRDSIFKLEQRPERQQEST